MRHFVSHRAWIGYVLLLAGVCLASPAWALDQIRTQRGALSGTIEGVSPTEITLSRSGRNEQIQVNEIVSIRFEGEPPEMNVARSAAINGRYEDALRSFDELESEIQGLSRDEIKQDWTFYKAYSAARLALGGAGDVPAAGRAMSDFVNNNKQSYHFYLANEVLGDLLVALNRHELAVRYYDELAQAPWPDYQMRAAIAKGRAQMAQKKYDEAKAEFSAALELGKDSQDPLVAAQRSAATLGLAECLAQSGQTDEAVKLVEGIIQAADPEAAELHARAYNTLGNCYRQAGRTKDALLAFLHVDVLYFSQAQEHAEALWNLAQLWDEAKQPDRASAARERLQQNYSGSPWSKK